MGSALTSTHGDHAPWPLSTTRAPPIAFLARGRQQSPVCSGTLPLRTGLNRHLPVGQYIELMKLAGRLGAAPCSSRTPSRINQHDAAVAFLGRGLDQPTKRCENVRHRVASSCHFQQVLLSRKKSLSPLPVIDVGLDHVPANNIPRTSLRGMPRR